MIESRKEDHIKICLNEDVEIKNNYWEDVKLFHNSAPEIDLDDIELEVDFLNKKLKAPLMIAGITGGYKGATNINKILAAAAEEVGIGIGVGSQRAVIENEDLRDTYEVIKDYDVPLVIGNIGAPQLIKQDGEEPLSNDQAKEALKMIDGDYLGIHFNYLQEVCQPEGDLRAKNVLDSVEKIASEVPVIAKETGGGVYSDVAVKLEKAGVKAIDVGGMGGTSFAAVEHYRANDETIKELSENLWDWGIPTPVSIIECKRSVSIPLIGTGGIRNGIEAAKALSLGADIVGIAGGILPSLMEGKKATVQYLEKFIYHMKVGLFLLGCHKPKELTKQKLVLTGELRDWVDI
ncbi:MAG: type 2 isopentenyl-diphosphate Delta-isomerase [Thermoplasmatota archaeon]